MSSRGRTPAPGMNHADLLRRIAADHGDRRRSSPMARVGRRSPARTCRPTVGVAEGYRGGTPGCPLAVVLELSSLNAGDDLPGGAGGGRVPGAPGAVRRAHN